MGVDITVKTLSFDDCTIGRLFCGSFSCFTLELPWKENQQDISCIPAGVYRYKKRVSPSKKTLVIELIDVPDRTYIQVHRGNYTSQILGCCLVGDSIKHINTDSVPDVANSGATMAKLLDAAPDSGTIEFIRSL